MINNLRNDYSPLLKLDVDSPIIGVKFSYFHPENIPPLEESAELSLCEILRKSQLENRPFYFSASNKESCIGKIILGMESFVPFEMSGQIGKRLGVFEEARANQNLYQFVPRLENGTVNYVLFSPADKLSFEPDVLVISAKPETAEIVMRAVTYSTGEMYKSSCTPVMGCAWFLVYPYKSGEVNYVLPAFIHGPHGRELWPSDTVLISIPYRWIPTVLTNLSTMTHRLPSHMGKQQYYDEFDGILKDLAEKSKTP